jgi:hypothetical protein
VAAAADPRPARRIVDADAGKAKVEREGACRLCGVRVAPLWKGGSPLLSLTRAHLVPKGMGGGGGDDVEENIIPLCGMGPGTCHERMEANSPPTRRGLRGVLRDDEISYIVTKKGEGWLDSRFPA